MFGKRKSWCKKGEGDEKHKTGWKKVQNYEERKQERASQRDKRRSEMRSWKQRLRQRSTKGS